MAPAGGDVSDSFVGECTTCHRDRNITVRVATVTELPVTVESPAGHGTVRYQRTRMAPASCDVSRWRNYDWSSSRLRRHHPSTRPNNNPSNKQSKNDKTTHESNSISSLVRTAIPKHVQHCDISVLSNREKPFRDLLARSRSSPCNHTTKN